MTKRQFFGELKSKTKHLTKAERRELISYYNEMISERMEDGMSEEEAVAALGSIDELLSTYVPQEYKAPVRRTPRLRPWHIVLIVLGSPVWISLLVAFFCLLLCFYIVIWAMVAACYAVFAYLAASSFACAFMSFLTLGFGPGNFFFCWCAALVIMGVALLWLIVCNLFAKACAKLTKVVSKGVFRLFFKR